MRRILDDPALAGRLALCARRTAEQRFSLDAMVRGTVEVYRQVLS
jgi:hypothetical protein